MRDAGCGFGVFWKLVLAGEGGSAVEVRGGGLDGNRARAGFDQVGVYGRSDGKWIVQRGEAVRIVLLPERDELVEKLRRGVAGVADLREIGALELAFCGDVETDAGNGDAGLEDDLGRDAIPIDVVLAFRGEVRPAIRTMRSMWSLMRGSSQKAGDVGERAHRDDGELFVRAHEDFDDALGGAGVRGGGTVSAGVRMVNCAALSGRRGSRSGSGAPVASATS